MQQQRHPTQATSLVLSPTKVLVPLRQCKARRVKALSIANILKVNPLREDLAGLQLTICLHLNTCSCNDIPG
jgi:hypothetical protein